MKALRYVISCGLLATAAALAAPIQVGIMPAKIVPEQIASLPLDRGIVSSLADDRVPHKRGDVLAILNHELMQQEREEMELKLARERITKKDEIRKLEAQRHKIAFYRNLSEKERRYAAPEAAQLDADTLADVDERIALLKREMDSLERHRNNELARKQAKNTLKMPFDGRVQYHFTLPEDPTQPFEYHSTGGMPFATVCDDSAFYVTINLTRAELTQLPEQDFSVEIHLPEGKKLHGEFSHRRVEQNGNGDMLVYFFRIPVEEHERAFNMLGSQARARLFYKAGEGTHLLNKAELAKHPRAARCRTWEELIADLYPEYHLILIGERDIVVRKTDH